MKIKILIFTLFCAWTLQAQHNTPAQDTAAKKPYSGFYSADLLRKHRTYTLPDATPFANDIKVEDLKPLVTALAADSMEGRETGEKGQRMAAEFIASQFKAAGIPAKADRNSYFQKILLRNDSWADIGLKVDDKEFRNKADFFTFPAKTTDAPLTNIKELVFVGYGIEDPKYTDYGKTDVKGKAVIFYNGEPMDNEGKSLITGSDFRSNWSVDWRRKVQLAGQKGATMAFIIDPNFQETAKMNRRQISTYGWKPASPEAGTKPGDINFLFITPEVATAIFGSKAGKVESEIADLKKGKNFSPVKLKTKMEVRLHKESKTLEGSNVVAVIEGSDSLLKKEFVFVTAHYDHLGMADSTVIYHGADDNASGTSGVIEIAKAFFDAKKKGVGPKRTVVCMLVSGEEKGLLGSAYYTEFPLFPLDRTVVDINIDMIGRVDELHTGKPDYVYVIGSNRMSTELHDINEMQNEEHTKLELDYRYNAKDDPNHFYERSDHYNFAQKGVPAIFYFNGTHADYHRPTDTADKIDFDALAKRAKLAFYTAWEIANRPNKLMINVPQPKKGNRD